ncbi:hypothetical protein AGABI2DRAFT_117553 [Agaricus bisporus var. bisporus H97]|uniref:hypothetical protein n=1 Tax=Agaricus bisporus var. bisporus (strain H97 / ATCC MYA-4626 / FGSC 10389) TaxID=936046 RepID=UPI00029F5B60|nr:hypothetical protein AGABI2DRAFT_117553 [Agaricus bisporus var. bisporus H97]EKV48753.1 hypothetical protein AGABI2DRAFT_117553 [Agaricus bisporus var. bisporus H97]
MLPTHDGTRTFLNFDIWTEIIRNFRWGWLDDQSTRKSKRATLRTISLLSRQLAPLSQSELWRTVSDVKDVARFIVEAEGSNVVSNTSVKFLRQPLDSKCEAQVLRILSYTRTLICLVSTAEEDLDWEFVLMATGRSPLFCNLETIIVDFHGSNLHSGRSIFPVIASSPIKRVIYHSLPAENENSALLLHSNLRMHNAPVTSVVVYGGCHISPGSASRLSYTSASGISLNINSLHLHPSAPGNVALWYLALSSSPNLTHLRLVMRTLISSETLQNVHQLGDETFRFTKLQRLEIHASGQHDDLLSSLDCPSLVAISLRLRSIHSLSTILKSMAQFKRIEQLSIITMSGDHLELRSEDLLPIINSLKSLRDLELRGVKSRLAEGDLIEILTTRTSMRTLIVSGSESTLLPLSLLFSIAEPLSRQLELLCLPFDFSKISSLQTPPVWPEITTTLKRFTIWDGAQLPDLMMREQLKLTELLRRLFPYARINPLTDNPKTVGRKFVEDLEELRRYISHSVPRTNASRSTLGEGN